MRPGRPSRAILSKNFAFRSASSPALLLFLTAGLCGISPVAAQDDYASRRTAAQGQFERAEALRATLEARSERERSLRDYEDLVSAYRRVYLITPRAMQVPSAIKSVADLYR